MIESIVEERSIETNLNEQQKNFIAYFYKYGFVGIMLDWIEKGMDEKHGKSDAEMEELQETLPAEPPVYGDPVTDSGVCLRL